MKEVDSMKHNRRILSLLLAICLIAALIPTAVFAEVSASESVEDDQIVVFGNGSATEGTPLEWIVIENNISEMVLLLKEPMDPMAYNASGLSNDWGSSDLKNWCASDAAKNLFTDSEWNALSKEKVFILSHDEVVEYWAGNTVDSLRTENGWWLRYDGEVDVGDLFGIAISDAGFMGTPHVAANYGVRPTIKIPTSNIALLEEGNEGNEDKLILKVVDSSAFADFSANISVASDYKTAAINYSGVTSGDEICIVLTDRLGNVVDKYSVIADSSSGSVELNLPDDKSGWYTVRAFVSDGSVTSSVTKYEFFVPDNLGNVVEWNINLNGNISANFNIELTDDAWADTEATKIAVSYRNFEKEYAASSLNEGETTGGERCVQLPVDMKAPQMNDVITIQVTSNDEAGGVQQFTIREYAEAIIRSDADEQTKDLLKHMLNYGAKAQTYFGYNASNLANAGVGVIPQKAVPNDNLKANQYNTPVEGIKFYGASVVMNSTTSLRFYFTLTDGDISDFTFGNGLYVGSKTVNGAKRYFVDIVGIAPHELNNSYDMYINGEKFVTYNPMAYIQRTYYSTANTSLKNLMQAMYNYYSAAVAYEASRT